MWPKRASRASEPSAVFANQKNHKKSANLKYVQKQVEILNVSNIVHKNIVHKNIVDKNIVPLLNRYENFEGIQNSNAGHSKSGFAPLSSCRTYLHFMVKSIHFPVKSIDLMAKSLYFTANKNVEKVYLFSRLKILLNDWDIIILEIYK